jgi:hypothetical protein
MSLEQSLWESLDTPGKTRLLKEWIQELIAIEKSIANPPNELYTKMKRRRILKNNIQDVTRYEQADQDYVISKIKKRT